MTIPSGDDLSLAGAGCGSFDVTAYGATYDAQGRITNARTITAAAVAAAMDSGGGTILFPHGTYLWSGAELDINLGNARLTFESARGTLIEIQSDFVGPRIFRIRNGEQVDFRGSGTVYVPLELRKAARDAASLSVTAYVGVDFANVKKAYIEWRWVGLNNYAIGVVQDTISGVAGECGDFEFAGECEDCGTYAIQTFPKVTSYNFTIRGRFKRCGLYPMGLSVDGVVIKAGQSAFNYQVTGAQFVECGPIGIGNWNTVRISGCMIVNPHGYGMSASCTPHPLYTSAYPQAMPSFDSAIVENCVLVRTPNFTPKSFVNPTTGVTYPEPVEVTNRTAFAINGQNPAMRELLVRDCTVIGFYSGYEIRVSGPTSGITFRGVTFIDLLVTSVIDAAGGAYPTAPRLERCRFINNVPSRMVDARWGGVDAVVEGCEFVGYGDRCLRIHPNGGSAYVQGCRFVDPNPAGASTNRGAIFGAGPGTLVVGDNYVRDPSSRLSHVVEAGTLTSIVDLGNGASRLMNFTNSISLLPARSAANYGMRTLGGGRRTWSATSAPSPSAGNPDDFVENSSMSVQGTAGSQYVVLGWLRLASGSWVPLRALTGT